MSDVRTLIALAERLEPAPTGLVLVPDYQDEERPEVRGDWRIGSEEEADWALVKLAEHEEHVASIEAQLAAAIARETKLAERRKAGAVSGAQFFRAHLEEYGEREKRSLVNGKKKSRAFLHGTIGWKKKGGRLTWIDEAATLAWAKARPVEQGLYRVAYSLEKKAIQDATKAEGIIPPGCELEPETDEIYVKAAKGEV